jgi:hypothetical protein
MCGRTNWCEDWNCDKEYGEEAEGKREEEMLAHPNKFHHHPGCNTIHYGHHNGQQVVIGCPCNYLATIEEEWWENRDKFLRFLKEKYEKRGKRIRGEEKELAKVLSEKD